MRRNIRSVWIVEMFNPDQGRWEPTVGAGLTRPGGQAEVARWRLDLPDDRFRLRRYCAVPDGEAQNERRIGG